MNGTGKTTLIDMLMDTEKYLYDGKIKKDPSLKIGYVSQFAKQEKEAKGRYEYLKKLASLD